MICKRLGYCVMMPCANTCILVLEHCCGNLKPTSFLQRVALGTALSPGRSPVSSEGAYLLDSDLQKTVFKGKEKRWGWGEEENLAGRGRREKSLQ